MLALICTTVSAYSEGTHFAVLRAAPCSPHPYSQYRIPRNQLAAISSKDLAALNTYGHLKNWTDLESPNTFRGAWSFNMW
jgi:hypothetical protein